MIRALLVDDHPVVTHGVEYLLKDADCATVCHHAHTGHQALEALARSPFDVVVLDIDLPDMNGIEVLKRIRRRPVKVPVLMLSIFDENTYAIRAIRAGAAGYLTKRCAAAELKTAIRRVSGGGRYITPTLAERLAEAVSHGDRLPHESLSDREYEVMLMLAAGKRVTTIGRELSIGHQTVSTYRRRILDKMDLQTNTEISHYCLLNGLLELGLPHRLVSGSTT